MDGETLRTRVIQLVQRTRKAVRLYTSAERLTGGEQAEFTALQLEQWQQINTELQRQLTTAVDHPNQKLLSGELKSIRDRFYHEWRNVEAEVHQKQGELLSAGEKGDFVRTAILGRTLVILKAREQASQAAHHELQELVDRTRVEARGSEEGSAEEARNSETIRLEDGRLENVEAPVPPASPKTAKPQPNMAKVIQLRTRQG